MREETNRNYRPFSGYSRLLLVLYSTAPTTIKGREDG